MSKPVTIEQLMASASDLDWDSLELGYRVGPARCNTHCKESHAYVIFEEWDRRLHPVNGVYVTYKSRGFKWYRPCDGRDRRELLISYAGGD